ncbi:Type cbb3 cytochrome oxidase biogenesis protein CcoH [hydrothermal vent metagenome]|uniref:Type cbb3 cytochrome oxidase biogenesis protein CcoH n=1 Tax=hydrothermal vent metagenome TaxID=652676 RepID=A0A3B0W396_9ZZZZ
MQAKSDQTKKQKEFTGWHMLIIMLSFFAVVFGMNILMATSALRAWTGLVVKNTYVASQEYNGKVAANRAQHALGWTSSVEFNGQSFTFSFVDGDEVPIKAEQVNVQINRVVGTKGDLKLNLALQEDGSYAFPAQLASGVWNIFVVASFADQPNFEHYYRIKVEG